MQHSRRHFLKLALTGAVWIGAGSAIPTWAGRGFRLPSKDRIKLRVLIASDGHYGQPKTMFESMHDDMVSWMNLEKAGRGADFAFINGDLFHDNVSFLNPVKQHWDKLNMPYYVSHGNHDMVNENEWEKTWKRKWDYGFTKKQVGFVVLNTADDKGTYLSPEIETTRRLLKEYERHKHLFVFMHITPVKWTNAGIDAGEVVAMFSKQSNLKAVFNGHDHDQDNVKEKDGRTYFFDSHVGGSWGTTYRGYRVLEVMNNGEVLTYQMNPVKNDRINSNTITV